MGRRFEREDKIQAGLSWYEAKREIRSEAWTIFGHLEPRLELALLDGSSVRSVSRLLR